MIQHSRNFKDDNSGGYNPPQPCHFVHAHVVTSLCNGTITIAMPITGVTSSIHAMNSLSPSRSGTCLEARHVSAHDGVVGDAAKARRPSKPATLSALTICNVLPCSPIIAHQALLKSYRRALERWSQDEALVGCFAIYRRACIIDAN